MSVERLFVCSGEIKKGLHAVLTFCVFVPVKHLLPNGTTKAAEAHV